MITTRTIRITNLRAGDVFHWGPSRVVVMENPILVKRNRVTAYWNVRVKLSNGNIRNLRYEEKEFVVAEIATPA